jgi:hypothetical protein
MGNIKHEARLQNIFNNVNDWLKFAEVKNFGLLSLVAAISFGITQIDFAENNVIQKVAYYILPLFFILSFLVALVSLFPIIASIEKDSHVKSWINKFSNFIDDEKKFENIHFYGYLKYLDDSEFEAEYLTKVGSTESLNQYEKELIKQILHNSRIASLKYQLFKISAFLFLVGFVVCIISLPFLLFLDFMTSLLN